MIKIYDIARVGSTDGITRAGSVHTNVSAHLYTHWLLKDGWPGFLKAIGYLWLNYYPKDAVTPPRDKWVE